MQCQLTLSFKTNMLRRMDKFHPERELKASQYLLDISMAKPSRAGISRGTLSLSSM